MKRLFWLKKSFFSLLLLVGFFGLVQPSLVRAQNYSWPTVYFFWNSGCPHCAEEEAFFSSLLVDYPNLIVKDFEISASQDNAQLLANLGQKLSVDIPGVPFTVIGNDYFVGYLSDKTTGEQIRAAIESKDNIGVDLVTGLTNESSIASDSKSNNSTVSSQIINIPLLGDVDLKKFSLPILTLVVGLLDGFNPCAMWTLLFLINLLLGMKDRKRMWLLGSAFIAASALVYFLFLSAWLNLFLFIGFVSWARIIIGLIALGSGGYYLYDYWTNKSGSCQVTKSKKRQKIFAEIKTIAQDRRLIFALVGIILLAFVVNLVELACSAGLPAIYTQVLSLSHLTTWQYYLYLILYVFVFMLDDLIVFFIAMTTLKITGLSGKYSRISHLIGGLLMIAIGLLLFFKPEVLMFG